MSNNDKVLFSEKIWPSPGFYIATLLIIPSMTVLFMPFSRTNGIWAGLILYAIIAGSFSISAPKVVLTENTLKAGRGNIEKKFLGEATALDKITYRQEIGRKLDARAFLAMSGWSKTGVRVEIEDKNDPTPYWIISTRKPLALVEALTEKK